MFQFVVTPCYGSALHTVEVGAACIDVLVHGVDKSVLRRFCLLSDLRRFYLLG